MPGPQIEPCARGRARLTDETDSADLRDLLTAGEAAVVGGCPCGVDGGCTG